MDPEDTVNQRWNTNLVFQAILVACIDFKTKCSNIWSHFLETTIFFEKTWAIVETWMEFYTFCQFVWISNCENGLRLNPNFQRDS